MLSLRTAGGGAGVRVALDLVRRARAAGVDVTAEAYPYTAISTRLQSALFDSTEAQVARGERRYEDIIWAATGEHLTAVTFKKHRAQGGWAIVLGQMPDSAVSIPLADSTVIAARQYAAGSPAGDRVGAGPSSSF